MENKKFGGIWVPGVDVSLTSETCIALILKRACGRGRLRCGWDVENERFFPDSEAEELLNANPKARKGAENMARKMAVWVKKAKAYDALMKEKHA